MMVEEGKKLNSIYIIPDLLEEIFLGLPLKSILKFKTVSKQWRSILESTSFRERHMSLQKSHRKILAANNDGDCRDRPRLLLESRFEGDEEFVFLHCNDAQRASMMTCDGLVCFPEPDYVNVLNPSTGQLRRFPSAPDPVYSRGGTGWSNCVMGFGSDKVTGRYKVVRMFFDSGHCEILDVEIGEWRKLPNPPPYKFDVGREPVGRKSVCVNGSIYWLNVWWCFKILALNLHTLEFHDVSVPDTWNTRETEIVNLQDRLAIVKTKGGPDWQLVIQSMDAKEEIWSKTYSISLAGVPMKRWDTTFDIWFTPMTISNSGDVVFCDSRKRLFKYHPQTNEIRCLSSDICVISPYVENLVPLRSKSGYHSDLEITTPRCGLLSTHLGAGSGISKLLKWITFGTLDIVFITLFVVGIRTTTSLCSNLYHCLL